MCACACARECVRADGGDFFVTFSNLGWFPAGAAAGGRRWHAHSATRETELRKKYGFTLNRID